MRYFDTEELTHKSITGAKGMINVKIAGGENGGGGSSMRFLFGTTNPTSQDGQPGDVYLNTENGNLYENQNGNWVEKGNLKGPQGVHGIPGEKGQDGTNGEDGVGIEDITSDNTNITFHLSNGTTKTLPWPTQGE